MALTIMCHCILLLTIINKPLILHFIDTGNAVYKPVRNYIHSILLFHGTCLCEQCYIHAFICTYNDASLRIDLDVYTYIL